MSLQDYKSVIDSIYKSRYFTNHGPLAIKLEESLQHFFNIENAVVVGNESLAIVIALAGLGISGRVGVSAQSPDFIFNAVFWAGLEPVRSGGDTASDDLVALLICDKQGTENLEGYFLYSGKQVVSIITIGETSSAPSAHCAAILTADATLAEKYRNIRSSYGARKTVDVRATANGRVSEFQAGMALLFLQNFVKHEKP